MARKKTRPLYPTDARRLTDYTDRAKDPSLSLADREKARRSRAVLMLSLWRAGWPFASLGEACGIGTTSAREQVVTLPETTKSVSVRSLRGEVVTPEPLPSERDFGSISEGQAKELRRLAATAANRRGSHGDDDPEREAAILLGVGLAYLYDKHEAVPTDMARACRTSNSRVRQRIREARGGSTDPFVYVYPESMKGDVKALFARLDAVAYKNR